MINVPLSGDTSRAMQESLEDVVNHIDENIERMKLQRGRQNEILDASGWVGNPVKIIRSTSPTTMTGNTRLTNSYLKNSMNQIAGTRPQRSNSTSRVPSQRLTQSLQIPFSVRNQEEPLSSQSQQQQQQQTPPALNINYLRKFQLFEEKLKKYEKQQTTQETILQELTTKYTTLQDSYKQEKKQNYQLKEIVATLKTRVDLLYNNSNLLPTTTTTQSTTTTNNNSNNGGMQFPINFAQFSPENSMFFQEFFQKKIIHEITKQLDDKLYKYQVQQELLQHSSSSKDNQQIASDLKQQHHYQSNQLLSLQETVSTLQKQCLLLTNEFEKFKTKQQYLDHIYTDLKDTVNIREEKHIEDHRKQLLLYKQEFEHAQQQLTSLFTTWNEKTLDLSQLQESFNNHLENMSMIFAQFDMKYAEMERTTQSHNNHLSLLKTKFTEHENKWQEWEYEQIPRIFQEFQQIHSTLTNEFPLCQQQIEKLEKEFSSLQTTTLETTSSLVQELQETRNSVTNELQKLSSTFEMISKDVLQNSEQFKDQSKKWKLRWKEILQDIHHLKKQQQLLETNIIESHEDHVTLTTQCHTTLQHVYETSTTLQRIQQHVDQSIHDQTTWQTSQTKELFQWEEMIQKKWQEESQQQVIIIQQQQQQWKQELSSQLQGK
jgi:chromosome segregation ATPase